MSKPIAWNTSFSLLEKAIKQAEKMSLAFEKREVKDEAAADDAYHFEGELRRILRDFEHRKGEKI